MITFKISFQVLESFSYADGKMEIYIENFLTAPSRGKPQPLAILSEDSPK